MSELGIIAAAAFVVGVIVGAATSSLRGRLAMRRLRIGEKVVHVTPLPKLEERAFDAVAFAAAVEEQYRREAAHPGPKYRIDQRVRAVQQRLSRKWGAAAFSVSLRKRIEEVMGK